MLIHLTSGFPGTWIPKRPRSSMAKRGPLLRPSEQSDVTQVTASQNQMPLFQQLTKHMKFHQQGKIHRNFIKCAQGLSCSSSFSPAEPLAFLLEAARPLLLHHLQATPRDHGTMGCFGWGISPTVLMEQEMAMTCHIAPHSWKSFASHFFGGMASSRLVKGHSDTPISNQN